MVRGLKDGKEVLKISVSALDSTLKGFCSNLSETSKRGGRPQEHVRFITRQGAARPNVDSIHIVNQRLLHLCFNFCFFFVFKPIFTEHP